MRRDPEDARFWLADVAGLDGAHTCARSLASLDRYVREVIVLAADLPDESEGGFKLEWDYETGDPDADRPSEELRRRSVVAQDGFSVREAATLLSISPARVDQMVQSPKKQRHSAA